jgi:hypothetical protein
MSDVPRETPRHEAETAAGSVSGFQAKIDRIDTLIDANRAALLRRLHFNPNMSAGDWQRAWDRCPDLWKRERALYRERGILQALRDQAINREWQTQQRRKRSSARKESRCGKSRTSPGASAGVKRTAREGAARGQFQSGVAA